MSRFKTYLKEQNIELSPKRYFIDAMGAMAQGLFASLLIGTILDTLSTQLGWKVMNLWLPFWFMAQKDEVGHLVATIAIEQSVAPPPSAAPPGPSRSVFCDAALFWD